MSRLERLGVLPDGRSGRWFLPDGNWKYSDSRTEVLEQGLRHRGFSEGMSWQLPGHGELGGLAQLSCTWGFQHEAIQRLDEFAGEELWIDGWFLMCLWLDRVADWSGWVDHRGRLCEHPPPLALAKSDWLRQVGVTLHATTRARFTAFVRDEPSQVGFAAVVDRDVLELVDPGQPALSRGDDPVLLRQSDTPEQAGQAGQLDVKSLLLAFHAHLRADESGT